MMRSARKASVTARGRTATGGPDPLLMELVKLLAQVAAGKFDIILAEALDRLSRDQEDIAGIYKRVRFADVKIVTLSEGEVSNLHIGLKGTMNPLFLQDLADKTRRGLRGRVEAGKSGGGKSYGYDVVRKLAADGTPSRCSGPAPIRIAAHRGRGPRRGRDACHDFTAAEQVA